MPILSSVALRWLSASTRSSATSLRVGAVPRRFFTTSRPLFATPLGSNRFPSFATSTDTIDQAGKSVDELSVKSEVQREEAVRAAEARHREAERATEEVGEALYKDATRAFEAFRQHMDEVVPVRDARFREFARRSVDHKISSIAIHDPGWQGLEFSLGRAGLDVAELGWMKKNMRTLDLIPTSPLPSSRLDALATKTRTDRKLIESAVEKSVKFFTSKDGQLIHALAERAVELQTIVEVGRSNEVANEAEPEGGYLPLIHSDFTCAWGSVKLGLESESEKWEGVDEEALVRAIAGVTIENDRGLQVGFLIRGERVDKGWR